MRIPRQFSDARHTGCCRKGLLCKCYRPSYQQLRSFRALRHCAFARQLVKNAPASCIEPLAHRAATNTSWQQAKVHIGATLATFFAVSHLTQAASFERTRYVPKTRPLFLFPLYHARGNCCAPVVASRAPCVERAVRANGGDRPARLKAVAMNRTWENAAGIGLHQHARGLQRQSEGRQQKRLDLSVFAVGSVVT